MIEAAKNRWGLVAFFAIALAGLINLALQPVGGHYKIFIGATRALMQGQSPYFNTFESPSGTWLYSPSCGLYFFRLFEWLPDRLGQWVFVASSLALLTYGMWLFFERSQVFAPLRQRRLPYNLFWLMAASEVTGAIANTRLELALVGVLLIVASQMTSLTSHRLAGGAALAKVTIWKFVSLPTTALLALVKPKALLLPLLVGALLWLALPLLELGPARGIDLHREWIQAVSQNAVGENKGDLPVWLTFVHLYRTAFRVTGYQMPYFWAEIFGATIALALAAFVFFRARSELWALAMGGFFSTSLMPASQSAGYVQWIPLLGLGFLCTTGTQGAGKKLLQAALVLSFVLVSLLSSDFVPRSVRLMSADFALKAVGSLALASVLVALKLKGAINRGPHA